MNIQQVRLWLAGQIRTLDTADLWEVTLVTEPELNATHTVQIGHAPPSPDTFAKRRVQLPVLWWVNEANEEAAVGNMYAAVSFAPGSMLGQLLELDAIRSAAVTDVGAEVFGPTDFVRAVSQLTVLFNEADEESS